MSELWASVMVNGYGYIIRQRGHVFEVRRVEPGGSASSSRFRGADALALLAGVAALAEPGDGFEPPR